MRIFAVSDTHGFFDETKNALDKAGFVSGREDHLLVVCGDIFDRGTQPKQIMDYFSSLSNVAMVIGNHEDLLMNMLITKTINSYDLSNGTVDTVMRLYNENFDGTIHNIYDVLNACDVVKHRIKQFFYPMVNFFETENHIFVHGWIPDRGNWRDAAREWKDARWENGICNAMAGANYTGKTIVYGHYHTSFGHNLIDGTSEFGDSANFSPFYYGNCIGIDGCTAHSGIVNVVSFEDDLLHSD